MRPVLRPFHFASAILAGSALLIGCKARMLIPGAVWSTVEQPGWEDWISIVDFSDDGSKALSAQGNTVKIWDVPTGKVLRTFAVRTPRTLTWAGDLISAAAFSPDGRLLLAAASEDGAMSLWDVDNAREIYDYGDAQGEGTAFAFSPDGRLALSGRGNGTVKLRDVASGRDQRVLGKPVHDDMIPPSILAIHFLRDGKSAASVSGNQWINIWDVPSGREIERVGNPTLERCMTKGGTCEFIRVQAAAFFKDDKRVLVGRADGSLLVLDMRSGEELLSLPGQQAAVLSVAVSAGGNLAASASSDGTLRIWDLARGDQVAVTSLAAESDYPTKVAFSPEADKLLVGTYNGSVRIYQLR